jgi:hypothetical protein
LVSASRLETARNRSDLRQHVFHQLDFPEKGGGAHGADGGQAQSPRVDAALFHQRVGAVDDLGGLIGSALERTIRAAEHHNHGVDALLEDLQIEGLREHGGRDHR